MAEYNGKQYGEPLVMSLLRLMLLLELLKKDAKRILNA